MRADVNIILLYRRFAGPDLKSFFVVLKSRNYFKICSKVAVKKSGNSLNFCFELCAVYVLRKGIFFSNPDYFIGPTIVRVKPCTIVQ